MHLPGLLVNHVGSRNSWRWLIPPVVDLALFALSLAASLWLRQPQLLTADTFFAFTPLFAFWLVTIYSLGLYDLRLSRDTVALIKNLAISGAMSLFLGMSYFYILSARSLTPKTHLLLTVALSHGLIFAWRRAWLRLLDFNILDQRFVFLGDPAHLAEIEKQIPHHTRDTGLSVVPWQWPGVDLVVVDSQWVDANWDAARKVFLAAVARGVPIVTLEDFYESIFGKVSPHYAGSPSWALEHILPKQHGLYSMVKRAVDLAGAAALLVLLAPVLGTAAALIALLDGRPVFFRQARVGQLGRRFMVLKFRTMMVGSETKGPFTSAQAHKTQVTRLGAWLRRFRVDELPQLWNVLRGEMSLVGPRPEWIREVEVLEKVVPSYHLRHLVRPGITGWAQVRFRATNSVDDSIEKIHFDLFYVKYLSFALDLSIALKTLKRVLVSDKSVQKVPAPLLAARQTGAHWAGDLPIALAGE